MRLTLHGDLIIDDDFSDERWLSVEEGLHAEPTARNAVGGRLS